MLKRTPPPVDAGLHQIADLERDIVQGSDDRWACHGVSLEEIERARPAVVRTAKAICDRLRTEYLARRASS